MAYDKNAFRLVARGIGDGTSTSANQKFPSTWEYSSAVDSIAQMVANGYISNGVTMGAKVGDTVNLVSTAGAVPVKAATTVAAVNLTTNTIDLGDATTVSQSNAT